VQTEEERRGVQTEEDRRGVQTEKAQRSAVERRPKKSSEERRGAQTEEVISDNYLSATVVSFQKKDCGSHFVPFFLHVILSVSSTTARKAATAFHFLSSFCLLSLFLLGLGLIGTHPSVHQGSRSDCYRI
jgi:hypothetical protein